MHSWLRRRRQNWGNEGHNAVHAVNLLPCNDQHSRFMVMMVMIIAIFHASTILYARDLIPEIYTRTHSGDEIANVNFYAVRPEATRIR